MNELADRTSNQNSQFRSDSRSAKIITSDSWQYAKTNYTTCRTSCPSRSSVSVWGRSKTSRWAAPSSSGQPTFCTLKRTHPCLWTPVCQHQCLPPHDRGIHNPSVLQFMTIRTPLTKKLKNESNVFVRKQIRPTISRRHPTSGRSGVGAEDACCETSLHTELCKVKGTP